MARVTFTLRELRRELVEHARRRALATHRVREWHDEPSQHAARETVLARGRTRLLHYAPRAAGASSPPLLIVYALVNRPTMADLMPGCSLIGELVDLGREVYLIDWGYPEASDSDRGLADYITGDMDACVKHILNAHGLEKLDLMGICQGGTFALCYAALRPRSVRRLITTVTPVDFRTPEDLLSHLAQGLDLARIRAAWGNVPGDFLNALFLAQKPIQLTQQKYLDFIDHADDEAASALFLAMEQWIFDSPALPGRLFEEFVGSFYQQNAFKNARLQIGGEEIRLEALTMPVLNIVAGRDHLVPPAASRALATLPRAGSYSEQIIPAGHIGLYVSAAARRQLGRTIVNWLETIAPAPVTVPQDPARKPAPGRGKKLPPDRR